MKIKYIAVLLLTVFITACERATPEKNDSVRPVSLFAVSNSTLQGVRIFPARILAGDRTDLSFKRGGQLEQLLVNEGQRVERGQLIAQLDNSDALLRLKDRQASFNLAQSQFNRYATLSQRHIVAQAELDVQRAARDSAQAALKLAQEEVNDTAIRAPFAGVIATVDARNYQIVAPGQAIATLNALDKLDVVFSLPESLFAVIDAANVQYQPIVELNNLPGREFVASYKEHTAQTVSGALTYQMVLSMTRPPDIPLLSGMSGRVKINLGNLAGGQRSASYTVPVEAVFNPDTNTEHQPHVWVVKDESGKLFVESRPVQLGQLTADGIQVVSGLSEGEWIVAAGTRELRQGQEVRAWVRERGL